MDCEKTLELIRTKLGEGTHLRKFTDRECLIRLPFWDNVGDPIEISVSTDGVRATIDDAGAIAGILFSLGQHTQDTPAFKLLMNLERAHGLEVDFNEGLLKVSVPDKDLYYGVAELTKIVLALHTVTPHIRVAPRRMKSLGGKRLRFKDSARVPVPRNFRLGRVRLRSRGHYHSALARRFPLVGRNRRRSTCGRIRRRH